MTYSIVARDTKTGELGVAVQSHWFSVGSGVTWARAGVCAIATQANVDISYGPLGIDLISSGKNASDSLEALLKVDPRAETRQVAFVDSQGNTSVHTGSKCMPHAGHYKGDHFTCQANIMRNDKIWGAMAESFEKSKDLQFAERLISALEGGEEAGGDARGRQSAAILVVSSNYFPNPWMGRQIDLRVEDSPDPLPELKRLLRIKRGYDWANMGDVLLDSRDFDEAFKSYERASRFAPEIEELEFWQAVSLAQAGKIKEARPIFEKVFRKNKDWIQIAKSLPDVGLLPRDKVMDEILGFVE